MKRIDRLIFGELLGPWVFGVAMFTTLLIAATYLGRIADYIVQGVPPGRIGEILLLLMPAILVKTFAMSTLLAALLAFGRLSGDSEIVAMRAAGASLWRIMVPVVVFATVAAGIAFVCNERLVPSAAKRSTALVKELSKSLGAKRGQPIFQPQYEDGKLRMMIVAQDFSLAEGVLRGVQMTLYNAAGEPEQVLFADSMRFTSKDDWRIEGGAKILPLSGGTVIRFDAAWPTGVPMLGATPDQIGASGIKDPDYNSMAELREQIARAKIDKTLSAEDLRDREFWYWNKLALPMAALVFGGLGSALGIRSARTGTATGFALAIGIIFLYFTVTNFMSVWAIGGIIAPWIASFAPIGLGAAVAAFVVARKNR